ncbi:SCPU domain-containing protein, partial [Burkholderia pseudomallei]
MSTLQRVLFLLGVAAWPAAGRADTLLPRTQAFTVSAQIVAGCGVAGGGPASGLNFGTLDFGAHPAVATGQ